MAAYSRKSTVYQGFEMILGERDRIGTGLALIQDSGSK